MTYLTTARPTVLFGTAAAVTVSMGLAAPDVRAETWDMPMAYAASNYHSENNAAFADAVTERTGGALDVKTHPGGSLVPGGEIFGAVRRGIAPIGERLMSALGNEHPIFEIDAVPFLATSFEDARKLYDASRPATEDVLADKGLKLLYAVPWPPQGLYAIKPIESVSDMEGLKFRAYNAATSTLAEMMGAIPTKIETAELSQAFATGVAESMISSGSTGYDRKIWEFVDYLYDVQAWLPKNMVFVNMDAWEALDEDTRAIVLEEAAKAEDAGWTEAQRLADWYKEQLAANGMTVAPPSDTLKSEFQDLGATMTEDWKDRAGETGADVLQTYNEM